MSVCVCVRACVRVSVNCEKVNFSFLDGDVIRYLS